MSDQQPPEDPWPAEDPFAPPGSVPAAPQPPQAQGPGIRTDTGEVLEDEGPSVGERLERLEEAVADIAELLRLSPGGPWAWHMLEPPARRELAEKLVTWVEWLSSAVPGEPVAGEGLRAPAAVVHEPRVRGADDGPVRGVPQRLLT